MYAKTTEFCHLNKTKENKRVDTSYLAPFAVSHNIIKVSKKMIVTLDYTLHNSISVDSISIYAY